MHRLSIVNKDSHKVLIYNINTLTTDFSIYLTVYDKKMDMNNHESYSKQSYSVSRIAAPVCGRCGAHILIMSIITCPIKTLGQNYLLHYSKSWMTEPVMHPSRFNLRWRWRFHSQLSKILSDDEKSSVSNLLIIDFRCTSHEKKRLILEFGHLHNGTLMNLFIFTRFK